MSPLIYKIEIPSRTSQRRGETRQRSKRGMGETTQSDSDPIRGRSEA